MKTTIKYISTAIISILLALQVNGQANGNNTPVTPLPGSPPSLNPTVPSNPQGLPPNSNYPASGTTPSGIPNTPGSATPTQPVPGGQAFPTPGNPNNPTTLPNSNPPINNPSSPTINAPTIGTPAPTAPGGPHGHLEYSCNGDCNHVDDSPVLNVAIQTQAER